MDDLVLGDFLDEKTVKHYNRFLKPGQILIHPRGDGFTWTATVISDDAPEAGRRQLYRELSGRLYGYRELEPPRAVTLAGQPVPVRDGALACSPSQVLGLSPEICWDVLGYYAALGAYWRAPRGQLRRAFMRRGAHLDGPGNARLAYILSQLLDRGIRRAYDRMPLGGIFLQDKDVEAALKRAAHAKSAGPAPGGVPLTVQDVLAEWGIGPQDGLPGPAAAGAQPGTPAALRRAGRWEDAWSWYQLGGDEDQSARSFWLERWQLLLVREFAARGMTARFAVGLFSGAGSYVTRDMYTGSLIVFLGKGEPVPQLAAEAAGRAALIPQALDRQEDGNAGFQQEQGRRGRRGIG